jgi:hypothetical protein
VAFAFELVKSAPSFGDLGLAEEVRVDGVGVGLVLRGGRRARVDRSEAGAQVVGHPQSIVALFTAARCRSAAAVRRRR